MHDQVKELLALPTSGVFVEPCIVTQITPLTVTLRGTSMPGVKMAGPTYSLGNADALWCPPAAPIVIPVLPIGA